MPPAESDESDAPGEGVLSGTGPAHGDRAGPAHGDRAAVEQWFRSRGLPHFVTPDRRASLLVARTAPLLALLGCADLAGWMIDRTAVSVDSTTPVVGVVLLLLTGLALVVLLLAPVAAFLRSGSWLRSSPRGMTAAGGMLTVYYIVVAPWLLGHPPAGSTLDVSGTLVATARAAVVVALALAATRLGLGSLASWSLRSAFRQLGALGQMTSRALPLLMLVVVVSLFSRTVWEVTNALSPARLAGVVAFFVVLGLLFIVPVTRRETVGLGNDGPPLSKLEHVDVTAVLVLAQGAQVAIFSVLVCVFLTALGQIAFTGAVLDSWIGPNRTPVELAGVRLPVDAALVRTTIFLSCVSSLNFLISATTTAAYRSAFYDPLFDDARRALSVRAVYRGEVGDHPG